MFPLSEFPNSRFCPNEKSELWHFQCSFSHPQRRLLLPGVNGRPMWTGLYRSASKKLMPQRAQHLVWSGQHNVQRKRKKDSTSMLNSFFFQMPKFNSNYALRVFWRFFFLFLWMFPIEPIRNTRVWLEISGLLFQTVTVRCWNEPIQSKWQWRLLYGSLNMSRWMCFCSCGKANNQRGVKQQIWLISIATTVKTHSPS